jgi:hypothetical protein
MDGGCLAASNDSTSIIRDSSFTGGQCVNSGGAVHINVHANMSISGSRFINNTCNPGSGGAVATRTERIVDISHSLIMDCVAGSGGGLHTTGVGYGRITLLHTNFTGSRGVTSGGGVGATRARATTGAAGAVTSVVAVTGGCLFSNNAVLKGFGSDMYSDGSVKFLFSGFGNNIGEFSPTVVQPRACLIGEVVENTVCRECRPPMYSLDNSSSSMCKGCPDFAACRGGAVIVPIDSFWHSGLGGSWPECT